MTCLVAWRGMTHTVVGTDSQWSQGSQRGSMPSGTMWRNGRFVIAAAGSVRPVQLLGAGPQFDPKISDKDLVNHLISEWTPKIVQTMNDAGQLCKGEDKTATVEVELLVVSRKKIVRVGGDLSIIDEPLRYAAGGSGEEVALGYMAACPRDRDERYVALGALKAASKHTTGCSAPYYLEYIK